MSILAACGSSTATSVGGETNNPSSTAPSTTVVTATTDEAPTSAPLEFDEPLAAVEDIQFGTVIGVADDGGAVFLQGATSTRGAQVDSDCGATRAIWEQRGETHHLVGIVPAQDVLALHDSGGGIQVAVQCVGGGIRLLGLSHDGDHLAVQQAHSIPDDLAPFVSGDLHVEKDIVLLGPVQVDLSSGEVAMTVDLTASVPNSLVTISATEREGRGCESDGVVSVVDAVVPGQDAARWTVNGAFSEFDDLSFSFPGAGGPLVHAFRFDQDGNFVMKIPNCVESKDELFVGSVDLESGRLTRLSFLCPIEELRTTWGYRVDKFDIEQGRVKIWSIVDSEVVYVDSSVDELDAVDRLSNARLQC